MLAELAENLSLKGKYGQKVLNLLGPSPVQLCKSPPFLTLCLLPRILSIRSLTTPKTFVCRIGLLAHQSHIITVENRWLVTSPRFLELSAHTSTLRPKTTLMASVRYRSTSSVKQRYIDPFFREVLSLMTVAWRRCEHLNGKHLPGRRSCGWEI